MATVDSRSRKRRRSYDYDEAPSGRGRKRKSHAFRNFCLTILVLGGVGLYFAPMIVSKTPLRDSLVQSALKLNGTITVGSVSLGWLSPVSAEKIEIRDKGGETAVELASLR